MKKFYTLIVALFAAQFALAGIPSGYYSKADGKCGAALKTALYGIINSHTSIGYKAVWTAYKTTDLRSDGKIWDIYSNTTNYVYGDDQAGSYKQEGDCYNREHAFCQSWFDGASSSGSMKCDVHHLFPTDGYVNNRRSNYPFGPVGSATYTSNNSFSKVGSCSLSGYSGTVFEPNDEYKGDIARALFYMVTCYQGDMTSCSSAMLSSDTYPSFTTWALNMLLEWAAADPVSEKEIARNEAIYKLQGNRNPYVDYPGLEQYVWGSKKNTNVDLDNYESSSTDDPDTPDPEPDPDPDPDTPGTGGSTTEFEKVYSASTLAEGDTIVIIYESDKLAMSTDQATASRGYTEVEIANDVATVTDDVQKCLLEGKSGAWYLYALNGDNTGYLATNSSTSKNALLTNEEADDYAKCSISISSGDATITFAGKSARNVLQYNSSSPRFSCYNASTQKAVQIYRCSPATSGIEEVSTVNCQLSTIYDLQGRKLTRLQKGVNIVNGRRVLVP